MSVTLDWFPAPTLCWQQLLKGKLMKEPGRPAINLSLADLLVVLEVLDRPAILLHYLWRRIEWEEGVDYLADEERFARILPRPGVVVIPEEVRGGVPMHMYDNSKELRRHYMAAWIEPDTTTPPPRCMLDRLVVLDHPPRRDAYQNRKVGYRVCPARPELPSAAGVRGRASRILLLASARRGTAAGPTRSSSAGLPASRGGR